LVVTGIANPEPLKTYVQKFSADVIHLDFGDHHQFTNSDLESIRSALEKLESPPGYIITTEKDSVRLREFINIDEPLRSAFYYIPVGIFFLNGEKEKFDKLILDYVGKNNRNNRVSEI
jgi:tetraacyldisaccharide 4'-kinase